MSDEAASTYVCEFCGLRFIVINDPEIEFRCSQCRQIIERRQDVQIERW